jgi:hypothetical protein
MKPLLLRCMSPVVVPIGDIARLAQRAFGSRRETTARRTRVWRCPDQRLGSRWRSACIKGASKRHGSSTETCADSAQRPESSPKSVSYSDGSPGQQDSGAKRDHHNSRPIRFDPKATRRSFRFQGVTGSRAKSCSTAESASPNWLIGHLQHAAENKEHTKPYECHARLPHQ